MTPFDASMPSASVLRSPQARSSSTRRSSSIRERQRYHLNGNYTLDEPRPIVGLRLRLFDDSYFVDAGMFWEKSRTK
ncbi:hypothetical protein [Allomesorhizobium camelthorni]|uniref:Uncharacterized protein n=1 Tax=Allomesorhizobium camelthorni TaxID=475069 RepID=A0A6G4WFK1_9HYPH|nr:hypothetical protein [Mesorhizobium camelthorni]NGO53006.1 hypothetical protein [Mesorhizobium camelthorni]